MTTISWIAIGTAVFAIMLRSTLNWLTETMPYMVWSKKSNKKETE